MNNNSLKFTAACMVAATIQGRALRGRQSDDDAKMINDYLGFVGNNGDSKDYSDLGDFRVRFENYKKSQE